jgi:hypothetical protein
VRSSIHGISPAGSRLTGARGSARKPGAGETGAGPALAFHDKAGSFSRADTEVVTKQLSIAGYSDIAFERVDAEVMVGRNVEEAVAFQLAIGPAGEVYREAGREAERNHKRLVDALKQELGKCARREGVMMSSSSWMVTARNPA